MNAEEELKAAVAAQLSALVPGDKPDDDMVEYIALLTENDNGKDYAVGELESFYDKSVAVKLVDWLFDDYLKQRRGGGGGDGDAQTGVAAASESVEESSAASGSKKRTRDGAEDEDGDGDGQEGGHAKRRRTAGKTSAARGEESGAARMFQNALRRNGGDGQGDRNGKSVGSRRVVRRVDRHGDDGPRKIIVRRRDGNDDDNEGDDEEKTAVKKKNIVVKRRVVTKAQNLGRIVVRNTNATTQSAPAPQTDFVHLESRQPPQQAQQKKIKCQYWPNCTRGSSCQFHHPTEVCTFFPNCKYGDACMNIHPATKSFGHGKPRSSVPCRFGVRCTNPRCTFFHPNRNAKPANPSAASAPLTGLGTAALKAAVESKQQRPQSDVVCRFGIKCMRPGCFFKHPDGKLSDGTASVQPPKAKDGADGTASSSESDSAMDLQAKRSALLRDALLNRAPLSTPCAYDPKCNRVSCRYSHPKRDAFITGANN